MKRELHLIAIKKKLNRLIKLGFIILIANIRSNLNLFYQNHFLMFFGVAHLLFLRIQKLTIIHHFGNRRVRVGGHFDKVEAEFVGLLDSFASELKAARSG